MQEERETIDGETDAAADAFDEIRKTTADIHEELSTLRIAIEKAFDKFDEYQPSGDYSTDIRKLVAKHEQVEERLAGIEQSPVLKNGAEHYGRVLEESGARVVQGATGQLETSARKLQQTTEYLVSRMTGARERRTQNKWLAGIGLVGIMVGILLTLLGPRFIMPSGSDIRIASFILGTTPSDGGARLIRSRFPKDWDAMVLGWHLITDNASMAASCRDIVLQTGQAQVCPVMVTPAASKLIWPQDRER